VTVFADGQTHRQMQTDFIICPMLYAIAMGQIITVIFTYKVKYVHTSVLFGRQRK